VGRVAALEVRAEAVALDRVGQDDGGLALELGGGLVRGVDLVVVVAAALEVPDLIVGEVLDSGIASDLCLVRRLGTKPPSSLRRSSMYCSSSDFAPGWKYGGR
jgi:hypothetical protein